TGWVAEITATVGNATYTFAVVPDYGTGQIGHYDLINKVTGVVFATVSQPGFVTSVNPQGFGQAPQVTVAPPTPQQQQFEQNIVQQVIQTLTAPANPANPNNPSNPSNQAPTDQGPKDQPPSPPTPNPQSPSSQGSSPPPPP